MKDIIQKIVSRRVIQRYIILILCLFVAAVNFNLFLNPLKIVTGGLNGISILLEEIFHLSPSWVMLTFSIVTLIIGFLILGFEKTIGAVFSTFVYPLFVNLTASVGDFIKVNTDDLLIISIFAGIILGLTTGFICKARLSQGGVILICESIARTLKVSISRVNFFMNAIIVIAGGFFFGFYNSLYAIIILLISSIIINRILLGVSNHKFIYIMTTEVDKVKSFIFNDLGFGITEIDGISGDSGNEKTFLMTVVATSDYIKVTEFVKRVDSKAFMVVTDSYQSSKV